MISAPVERFALTVGFAADMDSRDKPVSDSGQSCWRTVITLFPLVIHGLVPWIHASASSGLDRRSIIGNCPGCKEGRQSVMNVTNMHYHRREGCASSRFNGIWLTESRAERRPTEDVGLRAPCPLTRSLRRDDRMS